MATTSTKVAASIAAQTRAKTTKKAASKPTRRPVMLNGRPASNRHFLLDLALYKKASARCKKDKILISDVLRHGIEVYGAEAPSPSQVKPGLGLMPPKTLRDLKKVWQSGDSEKINHYLAALHRATWTTQAIADSLVASGAVEKMSRQAVSLRVLKAPEELREDLPAVPELGPRRTIVSARKGQKGEYRPAKKKPRDASHDLAFRVADEEYAKAARRAKHEGAMMSGVLDDILLAYLDGEYDEVFRGDDA